MKCKYCGTELPKGTKFCTNCGRDLSNLRKCVKCGEIIDDDATFCPYCGSEQPVYEEDNPHKKWIWTVIIILVIGGGALGYYFLSGGHGQTSDVAAVKDSIPDSTEHVDTTVAIADQENVEEIDTAGLPSIDGVSPGELSSILNQEDWNEEEAIAMVKEFYRLYIVDFDRSEINSTIFNHNVLYVASDHRREWRDNLNEYGIDLGMGGLTREQSSDRTQYGVKSVESDKVGIVKVILTPNDGSGERTLYVGVEPTYTTSGGYYIGFTTFDEI